MWNYLRCLIAHDYIVERTARTMRMVCLSCGHTSKGWDVPASTRAPLTNRDIEQVYQDLVATELALHCGG